MSGPPRQPPYGYNAGPPLRPSMPPTMMQGPPIPGQQQFSGPPVFGTQPGGPMGQPPSSGARPLGPPVSMTPTGSQPVGSQTLPRPGSFGGNPAGFPPQTATSQAPKPVGPPAAVPSPVGSASTTPMAPITSATTESNQPPLPRPGPSAFQPSPVARPPAQQQPVSQAQPAPGPRPSPLSTTATSSGHPFPQMQPTTPPVSSPSTQPANAMPRGPTTGPPMMGGPPTPGTATGGPPLVGQPTGGPPTGGPPLGGPPTGPMSGPPTTTGPPQMRQGYPQPAMATGPAPPPTFNPANYSTSNAVLQHQQQQRQAMASLQQPPAGAQGGAVGAPPMGQGPSGHQLHAQPRITQPVNALPSSLVTGTPTHQTEAKLLSDGGTTPMGSNPMSMKRVAATAGGSVQQARTAGQQAPPPRIDPKQIPRPNYTSPDKPVQFRTRAENTVPPAAYNDFIAIDEGNANPRFMRLSLGQIPSTPDLLSTCRVPLAVSIQPLAPLVTDAGERSVNTVDFGANGPVRCSRCMAYMNPFMRFVDGGRKFRCNFCSALTDVPVDYQCGLNAYNIRRDIDERPELQMGSVEYSVPQSYWLRQEATDPCIVFVVDVSYTAMTSGVTECAIKGIRSALEALNTDDSRVRVGLITFDTSLHFYNLSPATSDLAIAEVKDVNDPFCPLPRDHWLPLLSEAMDKVTDALDRIPAMYTGNKYLQTCAGAAAYAAFDGLQPYGGRVMLFQTSLSAVGAGKLSGREQLKAYTTDEERKLFVPAEGDEFYSSLAREAADAQVCFDVFVCTEAFIDAATVGQICTTTGGILRRYPMFAASLPTATQSLSPTSLSSTPQWAKDQLANDVFNACTREMGFEGVMKLRCSTGLKVKGIHGLGRVISSDEIDLAGIDSDKAIIFELEHDGSTLVEGEELYLQAALLYTNARGERRVRVHNLGAVITSQIASVFRYADVDTVLLLLLRRCCDIACSKSLAAIVDYLSEDAVEMLYSYRKYCASNSSPGQLILPESLKLLPLFAGCAVKSDAFTHNFKTGDAASRPAAANIASAFANLLVRADERVAQLMRVRSLPCELVVPFIYPRVYSLHDLADEHGRPVVEMDETETDALPIVAMPPSIWPSAATLSSDGVYLCASVQSMLISVGPSVSTSVLKDLFGVENAENLVQMETLPELDSDLNKRVRAIAQQLAHKFDCTHPFLLVPPESPLRKQFSDWLVEDTVRAQRSYVDYLCFLHGQIQNKMM